MVALEKIVFTINIAIACVTFIEQFDVTFAAVQTQRMKMIFVHFENELITNRQRTNGTIVNVDQRRIRRH